LNVGVVEVDDGFDEIVCSCCAGVMAVVTAFVTGIAAPATVPPPRKTRSATRVDFLARARPTPDKSAAAIAMTAPNRTLRFLVLRATP
jgi:hypothetical protein